MTSRLLEVTFLLIVENVVRERDASLLESGFDMIMMCLSSSKMRTVKDFERLLGSEGFEVEKVYRSDGRGRGVLLRLCIEGKERGRTLRGVIRFAFGGASSMM
jgi:hypothetical protein